MGMALAGFCKTCGQASGRNKYCTACRPPSKYRSKKAVWNGISFDSRKEMLRWVHLCGQQDGGLIANLRRQVPFPLVVNGQKIATYIADAVYTLPDKTEVVEDTKGLRTKEYRLKVRLFRALYGFAISEV